MPEVTNMMASGVIQSKHTVCGLR